MINIKGILNSKGFSGSERTVLVTGGGGYIGSTLCRELLALKYKVRVVDNLMYGGVGVKPFLNHPDYKFIKGDIRDITLMKTLLQDVRYVIHLAAIVGDMPCKRNPELSIEVNLISTKKIYHMAQEMGVKAFVFASTCSNYGIAGEDKPIAETGMLNPVSLYAETKVDCERFLLEKAVKSDMTTAMFRFGTAFGLSTRTRFDLLVNSFTYEALRDKKIMVFAPYTWRPYIHVLDISRVLIDALEADRSKVHCEVFNGGCSAMNYQKHEVVHMIKNMLKGHDIEVKLVREADDPRTYRVDFTKIEKVLAFKAVKSVEDGILEIADAIESGVVTFGDFDSNTLDRIADIAKNVK